MKRKLKAVLFFIVFGLMVISAREAKSQCAQCAATVQTNAKNGGTTANGLNKGILFLLAAPYLAVATAGFVWYKKYRRKNVSIDIPGKKLHLN